MDEVREKINEIYELKNEIWNYYYKPIMKMNDAKEFLDEIGDEVIKGNEKLETLINEFYKFQNNIIENMLNRNNEYINVINKAINIERIAKEVQGKVIDGGKLVGMIEKVHENASKYYQLEYEAILNEFKVIVSTVNRSINDIYNSSVGKETVGVVNNWYKNSDKSARVAFNTLEKVLNVYKSWNNELTTTMINKEHNDECRDEIVEQLKIASRMLLGVYNMFLDVKTPTQELKEQYAEFQEFIENKYK